MEKECRVRFKQGSCDAMTIALNRKFGWTPAVVRGYFSDDEDDYEDCHAVVLVSEKDGLIADAEGIRPFTEVQQECFFMGGTPKRIEMIKTGVADIECLFTCEGVSEEEIRASKEFIEENKNLFNTNI